MAQQQKKNMMGKLDGVMLRVPRSLLVFETTGFCLYGTVAKCGMGGSLDCGEPVMSDAPDFATAIGEVLEQLREHHQRLPKSAVLVTPSAMSELLQLPVDPKKARPRAQMKELVRWEFEEIFVQQNDIWSLGALLQGRGYVTPEQRRELESAATSSRDHGSLVNAYRDLVSREQLEECLTMQEPLMAMDDELMIGWSPLSGESEEGRFAWYCAGTSDGLCAQWVQAFKKHNVFCSGIYPQLGAAFPLVNTGEGGGLLIDVRQEQFGLFQGTAGPLETLLVQACPRGTVAPELVAAAAARMINAETRVVSVSAAEECLDPILSALKQALGEVEVRSITANTGASEGLGQSTIAASLEGVARHALRLCAPGSLVQIEAQAAAPPIWKTRAFWPWAIIVLLCITFVSIEISMHVQADRNEWKLEELDVEYDRRLAIKSEAAHTQGEIKRLEEVLSTMEAEIQQKQKRMELLGDVILYRQKLVPGVLQAIGEAIPNDVVVDLLEENADRTGFSLEGWSLRETEGQLFGNLLNEKLAPWNYKVGDIRLTRARGRLGVDGFLLKIRLIQTEKTEGSSDV
jgi:hypothetical protein